MGAVHNDWTYLVAGLGIVDEQNNMTTLYVNTAPSLLRLSNLVYSV